MISEFFCGIFETSFFSFLFFPFKEITKFSNFESDLHLTHDKLFFSVSFQLHQKKELARKENIERNL